MLEALEVNALLIIANMLRNFSASSFLPDPSYNVNASGPQFDIGGNGPSILWSEYGEIGEL